MKKLHLIVLSLLAVSLINHCPASSSGNPPTVDNMMPPPTVDNMMPPPTVDNMMPPPTVDNMMPPPTVDNMMPPPTDVNTVKTIHVHVRNDVSNNAEVVDLTDSITVTDPTYSILEGNTANIFSVDSSTGVITIADASKVTYDNAPGANNNNVHLLKVRVRNGTDTTKATEAPLRIVVRGFNEAFITTWTIPEGASTDLERTITIPTTGIGYNFTVDWGDDMDDIDTTHTIQAKNANHTYVAAGTYTVMITGTFPRIHFNNAIGDNKTKIKTVEQWGSTEWSSMQNAFAGASNLTVPAVDAPNLTDVTVTSMQFMFRDAAVFNQDISHWDTAMVENMRGMFSGATAFNQDISTWNTAMVENMSSMFNGATAFNQDLSTNGESWNTAMVNNMSDMFNDATAFNRNINSWNTAKVTRMSSMFNGATAFNQNISTWNTAMVNDMSDMFRNAQKFNQDISTTNVDSWNTAMVENMRGMFSGASAFDQDIGNWNTAMVTNMSSMFNDADAFNRNIKDWDVSAVTPEANCLGFAESSGLITDENRPNFNFSRCNP